MRVLLSLGFALIFCIPVIAQDTVGVSRVDSAINIDENAETREIQVSAAVRIVGPENQTVAIRIQWFDESGRNLNNGKKKIGKHWKEIVIPGVKHFRYLSRKSEVCFNNINVDFSFDELNQCNLPQNQTSIIYATSEFFWKEQSVFVDKGWKHRIPLVVQTDGEGNILEARPFPLVNFFQPTTDFQKKIDVRKMELQLEHLNLKPEVLAYETKGIKHTSLPVLSDGMHTVDLRGTNRGYFFQRIENEQQAIELARMGSPHSIVLQSKEDFDAIVSNFKKLDGWKEDFIEGSTDVFKTHVKRVPGLGFEVHSVYIRSLETIVSYQNIVDSVFFVSHDGRLSERTRPLMRLYCFDDFAVTKTIQNALSDRDCEVVSPMVERTKQEARIPDPIDGGELLEDISDWPSED